MAYLLFGIGFILLTLLSILNFVEGFYEVGFAYGAVAFCLVLFTVVYLKKIKPANEHHSRDKLKEWIVINQNEILAHGVRYGAEEVTGDTKLVQYCIVYSAIAFTRVSYTSFCIKGSDRSAKLFLVSTLFSALMGWWSLPSGPIETIRCLHKNFTRSEVITVKELLASG